MRQTAQLAPQSSRAIELHTNNCAPSSVPAPLLVLAELPIIFGHRILVALRHRVRLAGARFGRSRCAAFYRELQPVDGTEHFAMHLLDDRRVSGEAAWV